MVTDHSVAEKRTDTVIRVAIFAAWLATLANLWMWLTYLELQNLLSGLLAGGVAAWATKAHADMMTKD